MNYFQGCEHLICTKQLTTITLSHYQTQQDFLNAHYGLEIINITVTAL